MSDTETVICLNKETANLTVVLYSISQDCFHIETMLDYIRKNIRSSLRKQDESSYRLIGIFDNDIKADTYIDAFRLNLITKKEKGLIK